MCVIEGGVNISFNQLLSIVEVPSIKQVFSTDSPRECELHTMRHGGLSL